MYYCIFLYLLNNFEQYNCTGNVCQFLLCRANTNQSTRTFRKTSHILVIQTAYTYI